MAKAPSAGPLGSIPGQGTRSHMLQPRVHLPQLKIPLLLRRLTITRMAPASVTQSCLTLCNPVDCSPPGSSVHGILKARILESGAISLQGIFPTQGSNLHLLCLLHCRQILYLLSNRGAHLSLKHYQCFSLSTGYFCIYFFDHFFISSGSSFFSHL